MSKTNQEILKELIVEFNKYKGQLVIGTDIGFKGDCVTRLIGLQNDPEDDFFYIFYNGHKISYASVLCGFIPLKGFIRDKDYNRLLQITKFNHEDVKLEDNVYYRSDPSHADMHKQTIESNIPHLATPLCWDLN